MQENIEKFPDKSMDCGDDIVYIYSSNNVYLYIATISVSDSEFRLAIEHTNRSLQCPLCTAVSLSTVFVLPSRQIVNRS